MTDEDICGSTDTASGEPCQWTPGDSCPYHGTDDPPDAGRPTKLNKSRQEAIATMIEEGHSIGAAARSNGITVQTFFNWMSKGEQQDEGVYAEFFERITRARGVGEASYVEAITEIAKESGDTGTLMSMLKSRYPDAWADVEAQADNGGGIKIVKPDDVTQ